MFRSTKGRLSLAIVVGIIICGAIGVANIPVEPFKGMVERKLADHFGAPVSIGELERAEWWSYDPLIVAREVRAAQPGWAGKGDWLEARELRVRLPLWRLLIGGRADPTSIEGHGLHLALVRNKDRQANWQGFGSHHAAGNGGGHMPVLVSADGTFTLLDERRQLRLSGQFSATEATGLHVTATGRFHEAAAQADLVVPKIESSGEGVRKFDFRFASALLNMSGNGAFPRRISTDNVKLHIKARAASLKYLEAVMNLRQELRPALS